MMPQTRDPADPRGLIRESYLIEGIRPEECRSIFLDWALGVPAAPTPLIAGLLDRYGSEAPGHPMTQVLTEALATPGKPMRRGGRAGRLGGAGKTPGDTDGSGG
jgi:hypothetical protein